MLRPICHITITGNSNTYMFDFCESLSVEKSYNSFINTAELSLPNNLRYKNELIINQIERGNKISIEIGYYPNLQNVFYGYVSDVIPDENMKIMCEDEGFKAKQTVLENKYYEKVSLDELISDNYKGKYEINGDVPNLGSYKIENNPSFMEILISLKQVYGITSYWENEILKIDPVLSIKDKITTFRSNYNIIDSSNLMYKDGLSYNVVSECLSIQDDNTKVQWFAYYNQNGEIKIVNDRPDGVVSRFSRPNLSDSEAKELAKQRLEKLVYTGYVGSFVAFGKPFVNVLEKVKFVNNDMPDRDGVYVIESVNYGMSNIGFRQTIGISYKQ